MEAGIELNWLPPTDPNGEVHYVIYYTPEGGTEQSIDIGSNLTHYNLTGLERNRVYTNIAVQANNSAGRSERSTVIALPGELCTRNTMELTLHINRRILLCVSNSTVVLSTVYSYVLYKNTTESVSHIQSLHPWYNLTSYIHSYG